MIVKNEEEMLPRCLASVESVVSEMVVLDTGSTDRTREVAQSWGAKVFEFTWCNNFAIARNEALQYVQGDWVLVLDADEALTPTVVPALQQAIANPRALVVNLIRQEIGAEQSPYSLVSRLFRRHPQIRFSRPYHAMIDDSVAQLLQQEPHWQIVELPEVAILHDGYQAGAIAGKDKFTKARVTMEGFLAEHPDDPYVCSKLGALYVQMGDVLPGIELLHRGIQATDADPPVCYELHYHLGIAYSRCDKLDRAELHYRQALQQPILPRLKLGTYNNLGNLQFNRGDFAAAHENYQISLEIDPNFALAHYHLGKVLKAIGRLSDAIAHYQQAIALNPSHAEAHQNLGVALWSVGQLPQSLAAFRQAIALYEQQDVAKANDLRQRLQDILQGTGFSV